jgi:hypothetical protein
MGFWSRNLMVFPVPLSRFCRVFGKRKWEVAGRRHRDVVFIDWMLITATGLGPTALLGAVLSCG